MQVAVIGAGIAGIAVAIRLAAKGHLVTVFEAATQPGGKMGELCLSGYRFDTGPSLFTMPEEVEALFRCCAEETAAHLRYHKLEELCRYFYPNGRELRMPAGAARVATALAQQTGEPLAHLRCYMRRGRRSYRYLSPLFVGRSPYNWRTYVSTAAVRAYFRLPWLGLRGSLHNHNKKLFRSPELVQLFDRFATYCGSSPYRIPPLYRLIAHVETDLGAYFPEGGMYNIVQALVALARRQQVQFRLAEPVQKLHIKDNSVVGLHTKQGNMVIDAAISNMDIENSYARLLPQGRRSGVAVDTRSSAALIFYWGLRKESTLGLHNIFFSEDYRKEFAHIFEYHSLQPDPTVYINISSKMCAEDAPKGCENWFVMLNVSSDPKIDWTAQLPIVRKTVLAKLSHMLGWEIEPHMACESVLTPTDLATRALAASGALYGSNAHSLRRVIFRHPNRHPRIRGLYFCGGTVHPGGGIPLCLQAAKQVAAYF